MNQHSAKVRDCCRALNEAILAFLSAVYAIDAIHQHLDCILAFIIDKNRGLCFVLWDRAQCNLLLVSLITSLKAFRVIFSSLRIEGTTLSCLRFR